ncbi:hypothetical protein F4781DRAFT_390620 [Annulohypoxylon bovei var. microspora]|nr:hypothetical protein F4781DRAFT_390620 [Annulohypoxylon bovei var. microspora]
MDSETSGSLFPGDEVGWSSSVCVEYTESEYVSWGISIKVECVGTTVSSKVSRDRSGISDVPSWSHAFGWLNIVCSGEGSRKPTDGGVGTRPIDGASSVPVQMGLFGVVGCACIGCTGEDQGDCCVEVGDVVIDFCVDVGGCAAGVRNGSGGDGVLGGCCCGTVGGCCGAAGSVGGCCGAAGCCCGTTGSCCGAAGAMLLAVAAGMNGCDTDPSELDSLFRLVGEGAWSDDWICWYLLLHFRRKAWKVRSVVHSTG